jgi:hypothetical protein
MSIKLENIVAVILIFLGTSCRKEEFAYNREDVFSKDTTTLLFKASYLSHSLQDLNFQVELVTLNNLESEKLYFGKNFSQYDQSFDFDVSFSNNTTQTYSALSSYNTALVLDLSSNNIYDYHDVGIYLRRYFEIVDSLPNRNLAISSIDPVKNHPTRFHSEFQGDIFNNSWQYNTKTIYGLISEQKQTSSAMPMLFFKERIMETIDTLVAKLGASTQKSITLITSFGGFSGENQADMDEIVDYAIANNVQINLISEYEDVSYQRFAIETGGFCTGLVPNSDGYYEENVDLIVDPIQSTLLNLDALLTSSVTVHKVDIKMSKPIPEVWLSGEQKTLFYVYNNKRRTLQVRVP